MTEPETPQVDLDDLLSMFMSEVVIEAYGTVTNPPTPDAEES